MRCWYAVYTKYRAEKLVARQLDKKGVDVYVPLLKKIKRYSRKVVETSTPLISCYVFVCISHAERTVVLETEYVHGIVKYNGREAVIPKSQIELLRRIVGENYDIVAERTSYDNGDLVEVIAGSLTGLVGKVVEKCGKKDFIIELEQIGYSLRMKVDPNILRERPLLSVS